MGALLALVAVAALGPAAADPTATPEAPPEKLRILVDKVLMAANDWVMTDDHVRQIAAAGFNVVSPRRGNDDPDEVRRIARLAGEHGIRHMPWMRGTLATPEEEGSDQDEDLGNRLVWADGVEQPLYSPNSDELWDWLEDRVLGYARTSVEEPALMGTFVDFENYAPRAQADAYSLSHDAGVLRAFARAYAIDLPDLPRAERRPWLEESQRHAAFEAFQVERWQRRCRQLRQAVDAINPSFQFCVRPAPGTPFIEKAVWTEWGTADAPLILADSKTYGRPSSLLSHAEAVEANRRRIADRRERVSDPEGSIRYIGGIDPIIMGADPEFSGKNAVMLAGATDGYWVFYEGLTYDGEHPAYFEWFTWANRAITEGRFEAGDEPRQTPDPAAAVEALEPTTKQPQLAAYGLKPHMLQMIVQEGTYEVHELRGISSRYLQQVDVVVLQNFNVHLDYSHPWVQALRQYVLDGGGLMIAHDTGWYMASPTPEIAARDYPTRQVESVRHVVETDLRVVTPHPALGALEEGISFFPDFRDHMIFRPGERGAVVIENGVGDPVYVVGELGAGRVVFTGSYYGYNRVPQSAERTAFLACLKWLAADR